jgi:polar amino acid transport system substrate-binding protein
VRTFLLVATVLLGASSLQAQASDKELVFSTIQGSFNGLLAEAVLKEVYGRLGIAITTIPASGSRALEDAENGITDGEVQRIRRIGELNPTLLRVEVPLFPLEAVVFVKDAPIQLDGVASLKPYNVGIVRGVLYAEEMSKQLDHVTRLTDHAQLFQLLDRGRLDAVIINRYSGLYTLQQEGITGIHTLQPPLLKRDLYHYLHEKHADLVPQVEAVLREMQDDGSLAKLVESSIATVTTPAN